MGPCSARASGASSNWSDSAVWFATTSTCGRVGQALTERGGGLSPDAPLVPLRISRSPRTGATVGSSGLGIASAGGAGDSGTVVEDKVFYANVDTDTDLIVEPTLSGVETFTQLRSVASPEDPALDLRLPPGWQVSTHETGHSLGLDDNGLSRSVMKPRGSTCNATDRVLGQPDVQGVRYLYGD